MLEIRASFSESEMHFYETATYSYVDCFRDG